MSFELQSKQFRNLDQWFSTAHGRVIGKVIHDELSDLNDLLLGDRLLQLGSCSNNSWLNVLNFQHKWIIHPERQDHAIHCAAMLDDLPLDRDSIDCLIAPFTVDAFRVNAPLIDEIDRVLKPMGYVVFFGINPYSLWGLWLRYSQNNCFGGIKGSPHSLISLKRMMMHRGYHHCYCHEFYYIPPVREARMIYHLDFLNQVGKMLSPMPSAFYCLVMQKQVENYIDPTCSEKERLYLKNSPLYQPVCYHLPSK